VGVGLGVGVGVGAGVEGELQVDPSPPHTPQLSGAFLEKGTPSQPRQDFPSPPQTLHTSRVLLLNST
jgi:hypothetical protein